MLDLELPTDPRLPLPTDILDPSRNSLRTDPPVRDSRLEDASLPPPPLEEPDPDRLIVDGRLERAAEDPAGLQPLLNLGSTRQTEKNGTAVRTSYLKGIFMHQTEPTEEL